MNQVYGEPAEVRAADDGRPARFVWRGRLYAVGAILEHWVINRQWWRDPGGAADPGGGGGQPELEFWRVEATAGPGLTAGVYELRRDVVTNAWTLRQGLSGGLAPLHRGAERLQPDPVSVPLGDLEQRLDQRV